MTKSKQWWRDNSEKWLKQVKHFSKENKGHTRHFKDEENLFAEEIKSSGFKKILEVGAGNGRIIGRLSEFDCHSVDINKELSEYVKNKYPKVKTHVGEIIKLPFKDNEFDLVYTHEVLQHVEPEEIEQACSELLRVGKEVWCMESWRDVENGKKVSDSHSGRWNWDLKKCLPVYYDYYTEWGQLFVKAK